MYKHCIKCKTVAFLANEVYCPKCGKELTEAKPCKCGEYNLPHHIFCVQCGRPLK